MSDVPEADALEQDATVDEGTTPPDPDRLRIPDDVPEADALEQAETVPDDQERGQQ